MTQHYPYLVQLIGPTQAEWLFPTLDEALDCFDNRPICDGELTLLAGDFTREGHLVFSHQCAHTISSRYPEEEE